ncbi:MAG: shikimate dehydrogenase [Burkholderiales bacterium]|jgi:shikimate dehydrogenase|nr:shikimate dehydrogenase [Burkholderiales bacterium]
MKEYKLAVVGNPIEHSLSPVIFKLFAKQFNVELSYNKMLAQDAADFKLKVNDFFKCGGLALNVTSPFKNDAYEIALHKTSRANFCKAANFIRMEKDKLLADTTDGIGLVEDITGNKKFKISGKKILVLGSGFVLDSILLDLIAHNPSQINILARNTDRIDYLSKKFATDVFDPITYYDIIFNSTPNTADNSLFSQVKCLSNDALCYDLTYNKESLFLASMKKQNTTVNCYNGLGMLVEQAKIAFMTLFDYIPDTAIVLRELAVMGYK